MKTEEKIQQARENWVKASMDLSFKIISPYYIEINGKEKEIFAFLPRYGSIKGTLVELTSEPDFKTDSDIICFAKENNIFCSFINMKSCLKYDQDYFKETLEDWGGY
jgi:hypothetical protein